MFLYWNRGCRASFISLCVLLWFVIAFTGELIFGARCISYIGCRLGRFKFQWGWLHFILMISLWFRMWMSRAESMTKVLSLLSTLSENGAVFFLNNALLAEYSCLAVKNCSKILTAVWISVFHSLFIKLFCGLFLVTWTLNYCFFINLISIAVFGLYLDLYSIISVYKIPEVYLGSGRGCRGHCAYVFFRVFPCSTYTLWVMIQELYGILFSWVAFVLWNYF